MTSGNGTGDGTPPLPPRNPNPLLVHAAVDSAVAFLLIVVVLLILDVSIWMILAAALVLGVAAAPLTRRAEERALARRHPTG